MFIYATLINLRPKLLLLLEVFTNYQLIVNYSSCIVCSLQSEIRVGCILVTIVEDFVSLRTTAQSIMQSHLPQRGINLNTIIVRQDITGRARKKETEFSKRTTTGREHIRITISVDGVVIGITDIDSGFVIPFQLILTNIVETMMSIGYSTTVLLIILLVLFVLKANVVFRLLPMRKEVFLF